MSQATVLLTGGSSGIGWFATQEMAKSGNVAIITASRSAPPEPLGRNVQYKPLDLLSSSSITSFVNNYDGPPITSLVMNAALFPGRGPPKYTQPDAQGRKHEITLAASHIGHAQLLYELARSNHLDKHCRIIFVTSATHDPEAPGSPNTPHWTTPESVDESKGKEFSSSGTRYANAKLAGVFFAHALKRKMKAGGWEIIIFEPGFAPGGGSKLGREFPSFATAVMSWIAPVFRLRGTLVSTPSASGKILADFALKGSRAAKSRLDKVPSGSAPYYKLYNEAPTSKLSYDKTKQDEVWEWTRVLCGAEESTWNRVMGVI